MGVGFGNVEPLHLSITNLTIKNRKDAFLAKMVTQFFDAFVDFVAALRGTFQSMGALVLDVLEQLAISHNLLHC